MADPLQDALNRSTPGFDSLVNVIKEEANKMERNRQMARQLSQRKELAQFQADLDFAQQKRQIEELNPIELEQSNQAAIERAEAQQQIELEALPIQRKEAIKEYAAKQAISNSYAVGQAEAEQAAERSDEMYKRYDAAKEKSITDQRLMVNQNEAVYANELMPKPTIEPQPYGTQGYFENKVVLKGSNGENIQYDQQTYNNRAKALSNLGKFVTDLKENDNLYSTEDGQNIERDGILYISKGNEDNWATGIKNQTFDQKLDLNNKVTNSQVKPLDYQNARNLGLIDEGQDDSDEVEPINLDRYEQKIKGKTSSFLNFWKERQKNTSGDKSVGIRLPQKMQDMWGVKELNPYNQNVGTLNEIFQGLKNYLAGEQYLKPYEGDEPLPPDVDQFNIEGLTYIPNNSFWSSDDYDGSQEVRDAAQALSNLNDYNVSMGALSSSNYVDPEGPQSSWRINMDADIGQKRLQDFRMSGQAQNSDTTATQKVIDTSNPFTDEVSKGINWEDLRN